MASICEIEIMKGIDNSLRNTEGQLSPEILAGICHHIDEVKKVTPGGIEDHRGIALICDLIAHRPGVLDTLRELSNK